jgi:hypothetical protein
VVAQHHTSIIGISETVRRHHLETQPTPTPPQGVTPLHSPSRIASEKQPVQRQLRSSKKTRPNRTSKLNNPKTVCTSATKNSSHCTNHRSSNQSTSWQKSTQNTKSHTSNSSVITRYNKLISPRLYLDIELKNSPRKTYPQSNSSRSIRSKRSRSDNGLQDTLITLFSCVFIHEQQR